MAKVSKKQLFFNYCEMLSAPNAGKIGVTQLVNYSSVSRQAFYYHFSGIDELVRWGVRHIMGSALFEGRKSQDFTAAAGAYLEKIAAHRNFLFQCLSAAGSPDIFDCIKNSASELTRLFFNLPGERQGAEKAGCFMGFVSSALAMAAYDAVRGGGVGENTAVYLNELLECLSAAL